MVSKLGLVNGWAGGCGSDVSDVDENMAGLEEGIRDGNGVVLWEDLLADDGSNDEG